MIHHIVLPYHAKDGFRFPVNLDIRRVAFFIDNAESLGKPENIDEFHRINAIHHFPIQILQYIIVVAGRKCVAEVAGNGENRAKHRRNIILFVLLYLRVSLLDNGVFVQRLDPVRP